MLCALRTHFTCSSILINTQWMCVCVLCHCSWAICRTKLHMTRIHCKNLFLNYRVLSPTTVTAVTTTFSFWTRRIYSIRAIYIGWTLHPTSKNTKCCIWKRNRRRRAGRKDKKNALARIIFICQFFVLYWLPLLPFCATMDVCVCFHSRVLDTGIACKVPVSLLALIKNGEITFRMCEDSNIPVCDWNL